MYFRLNFLFFKDQIFYVFWNLLYVTIQYIANNDDIMLITSETLFDVRGRFIWLVGYKTNQPFCDYCDYWIRIFFNCFDSD